MNKVTNGCYVLAKIAITSIVATAIHCLDCPSSCFSVQTYC